MVKVMVDLPKRINEQLILFKAKRKIARKEIAIQTILNEYFKENPQ